jgi:hypothetical protein
MTPVFKFIRKNVLAGSGLSVKTVFAGEKGGMRR